MDSLNQNLLRDEPLNVPTNTSSELETIDQIETLIHRRRQIYDALGKFPSFGSFELAAANNKGVNKESGEGYKVYDMESLQQAWRENMSLVSKRKQSKNHWTAGLKKWLAGSWRKDGRTFFLTINDDVCLRFFYVFFNIFMYFFWLHFLGV
eukprot:TRINITY_DN1332_c0_g1_i1.p1 TRINITY_DN1332_c0_g1~~TRINITY_DN1332_c0_g1_i1.p1  ORF type:complete len:151 (-),score=14.52 TRINITY_DN1332_c0_g1_i1:426-878(-)